MSENAIKTKTFNTQKSVRKATGKMSQDKGWGRISKMEQIIIIRKGVPYESIEIISQRLNRPIKQILSIVGIPQTTYNKKKSEHALLDRRDSELIMLINELIDFGTDVFNQEEEKFQRWLKKPNLMLDGNPPESMLDTSTGIEEVRSCLNRIEYGNFS